MLTASSILVLFLRVTTFKLNTSFFNFGDHSVTDPSSSLFIFSLTKNKKKNLKKLLYIPSSFKIREF